MNKWLSQEILSFLRFLDILLYSKVSWNRRNDKIPWIWKVSRNKRNDQIPWKVIISRDFVVLLFLDTLKYGKYLGKMTKYLEKSVPWRSVPIRSVLSQRSCLLFKIISPRPPGQRWSCHWTLSMAEDLESWESRWPEREPLKTRILSSCNPSLCSDIC